MQASVAQQSFILELQIIDNEILQANTKLKSLPEQNLIKSHLSFAAVRLMLKLLPIELKKMKHVLPPVMPPQRS